ncbi:unnamed protein product [Ostreobium quekettii]|uniref:Ferritin n=1 Tax=Ostreobium quekettii TaxID=121088 RepID=A0A8S1INW6_9CHLO|nr:unnamed protein product [Ostreobium quekettii]
MAASMPAIATRAPIASKGSAAAFQRTAHTAWHRAARPGLAGRMPAAGAEVEGVAGVVFQPFDEAAVQLATIDKTDSAAESFARCDFHPECEAAINEQINVEYNISYVYHAMFAFFDRDNVGLPGLAEFFKNASEDERGHAQKLMEYQNVRGGRVKLGPLVVPETEYNHAEKGEALYAMELALSLEKLNFQKLRHLHDVADKHNDAQMCDFVEGQLLAEQVEDIKEVSVNVSQLRRVGKGHGVYHFDQEIGEDGA